MNELIKTVLSALDRIEVRGRENLETLLGCMTALETLSAALETAGQSPEKKEDEDG